MHDGIIMIIKRKRDTTAKCHETLALCRLKSSEELYELPKLYKKFGEDSIYLFRNCAMCGPIPYNMV
jgi:hypothetical protein